MQAGVQCRAWASSCSYPEEAPQQNPYVTPYLVAMRSDRCQQMASWSSAKPGLQGSWKGKSAIIGFFWAKAADCDFVMVTRAGLELYTLAADRQASTPSCAPKQSFCR